MFVIEIDLQFVCMSECVQMFMNFCYEGSANIIKSFVKILFFSRFEMVLH